MKRNVRIACAVLICAVNLIVMAGRPSTMLANTGTTIKGITGSYQGHPICHCPDDAKNCECVINSGQ